MIDESTCVNETAILFFLPFGVCSDLMLMFIKYVMEPKN